MADKVFIDTNVLLRYALKQMDGHEQANHLVQFVLKQEAQLWINGQVIREFIAQATNPRTLSKPLSVDQVLQNIETIKTIFQVADETPAIRAKLLDLVKTYPTSGKQIHDANIVATMLIYDINKLLTFNLEDFKRFSSLIILISSSEGA